MIDILLIYPMAEELQRVMKGHVQCWFEAENATMPSR